MRVNYMSDIHLEYGDYHGPVGDGNVLLLAGDICQAAHTIPTRAVLETGMPDRINRFLRVARRITTRCSTLPAITNIGRRFSTIPIVCWKNI
ncbi:metallophosphoesterase [Xanthomonas phage JGB6]|nr:metallophosphoesterase [Xanthomonas phage JGB6]